MPLRIASVIFFASVAFAQPVSFGVRGATLVFGLPGNPVSSLVACELFVKPAIRALQGMRESLPLFERGTLGSPLRRGAGRDELVRAVAHRLPHGVALEPLQYRRAYVIDAPAGIDSMAVLRACAAVIVLSALAPVFASFERQ